VASPASDPIRTPGLSQRLGGRVRRGQHAYPAAGPSFIPNRWAQGETLVRNGEPSARALQF